MSEAYWLIGLQRVVIKIGFFFFFFCVMGYGMEYHNPLLAIGSVPFYLFLLKATDMVCYFSIREHERREFEKKQKQSPSQ